MTAIAAVVGSACQKSRQQSEVQGPTATPARTIRVSMHDTFRYEPDEIVLTRGEVVRVEVVNDGKLPHELLIGDEARMSRPLWELGDGPTSVQAAG